MAIAKKVVTKKVPKSETRVGWEKTVSEIQSYLIKAGAKKISFDYDEANLPSNITFSYHPKAGNMMLFSLPIRFNGVSKLVDAQGGTRHSPHGKDIQPVNIAWRIMKDWIISQLALVDAEMAELPEVFLPYAVTNSGETLWENIKNSNDSPFKLLT